MAIPVAIFDRDIMPNPEGLEKRDYGQCAIRSDGEYVDELKPGIRQLIEGRSYDRGHLKEYPTVTDRKERFEEARTLSA